MTGEDGGTLQDLLVRLEFILAEPVDFTRSDTATTIVKVRVLTAAAIYFNILSVTDFGGRAGQIRGEGFVEQVVAAAFQTYEGIEPHPDPFEKAAVLIRGITQGHPFSDGNKRTGFLLAAYFLKQVGHPWPDPIDDPAVIGSCLRVSAGEIRGVDAIAAELRRLWGQ